MTVRAGTFLKARCVFVLCLWVVVEVELVFVEMRLVVCWIEFGVLCVFAYV